MKSNISNIKSSGNMFIFANKINNIYEMKPQDYEKLIRKNKKKQTVWKPQTSPKHMY